MMNFVLLETLIQNANVMACRISCLSNGVKNILYVTAIMFISCGLKYTTNPSFIISMATLCLKTTLLAALTNTLFSIHPPLLYMAIFTSVRLICYRHDATSMAPTAILYFSMLLGGFWSMQELSWGGWWNWDVLECGVAYIWLAVLFCLHLKPRRSISVRSLLTVTLILCFCQYTALNKTGLATSIHSFVTTKSLRNHYTTAILIYLIISATLYYASHGLALVCIIMLTLTYLNLRWCYFFKKAAVLLYFSLNYRIPARRSFTESLHKLISLVYLITITFNFLNATLFSRSVARHCSVSYNTCGHMWGIDMHRVGYSRIIWEGLFLSKPRYCLGYALNSYSTRNLTGRLINTAYLK